MNILKVINKMYNILIIYEIIKHYFIRTFFF